MDVNFRYAQRADLPMLYKALREMVAEQNVEDRFHHTLGSLEEALFNQKLARVLIAEVDGQYVAHALYSKTNRNFLLFDKPGLYLHDLYVIPDFRRQGIATKIMTYLRDLAHDSGCGRVDFVVFNFNQGAIDMYNKLGDTGEVDYVKYMRMLCP